MLDALNTVLADAVGPTDSAYVLGFADEVAQQLVNRLGSSEHITRVRSAQQLTAGPRSVVIAGPEWETVFAGEASMTYADHLAALNEALAPGGTLAVYTANSHSLAPLLDVQASRVASAAVPADGTTPTTPGALIAQLTSLGHSTVNVHSFFGGASGWCAVSQAAADRARPGDIVSHAIARALDAQVSSQQQVMPASDLVDRLASTQLLPAAAFGFLALVGGRGRSLYSTTSDGEVQWLDRSAHDTKWGVGADPNRYDGQLMLPVAPSAATLLLEAIETEDTAAFRAVAARLGKWTAQSSDVEGLTHVDWRDVLATEDDLTLALDFSGERTRDADADFSRDLLLASAWREFTRLARRTQPVMPWPQTWGDDELMRLWLSMTGVAEPRIEELLELVPADEPAHLSLREAIASSELYSQRATALQDEVHALQVTLHQQEEELAVRGRAIRSLRQQALNASRNREMMEKANQDIKNSMTFRLASQFRKVGLITRPKTLVKAVGKKAEKGVRSIRRLG